MNGKSTPAGGDRDQGAIIPPSQRAGMLTSPTRPNKTNKMKHPSEGQEMDKQ